MYTYMDGFLAWVRLEGTHVFLCCITDVWNSVLQDVACRSIEIYSDTLQSVLCIPANKYLVRVLVVLLHARLALSVLHV